MSPNPLADPVTTAVGGFSLFFVAVVVGMALLGLAFVAGGVVLLVRSRRRARELAGWSRTGVTTRGEVVDNRMRSGANGSLTFSPVVRFEADGRAHTVVGEQTSLHSFVAGQPATVVYSPAEPARAGVVVEGVGWWGTARGGTAVAAWILIGGGVVFLVGLAVVATGSLAVLSLF
ncbi:DUF3592 domain-containing protein [Kineococcus gynurae]|uniref:DUF3592 domain-containing protein n=1 Tax=Kineococcus gynurae TaxID=452979 RepID=A0ABV5LVG6_9ACTN